MIGRKEWLDMLDDLNARHKEVQIKGTEGAGEAVKQALGNLIEDAEELLDIIKEEAKNEPW